MNSTPIWTVYFHVHVTSGRIYVGLTKKSVTRRWKEHVRNAAQKTGKGCRHFWNAIRAHGKDAFTHYVLMQLSSVEEGNAWEAFWIDFFDTRNSENGFNLARGGRCKPQHMSNNPWHRPGWGANSLKNLELGRRPTPEMIARITARNKTMVLSQESRTRISEFNRSRIVSEETRAKISTAGTGRKLSPEHAVRLREMGAVQSARLKARTHCKHGHSLADARIRKSDNERMCRTCCLIRERRIREKRKEAKHGKALMASNIS